MSRTPEIIIDRSRKRAHYAFGTLAFVFYALSAFAFISGGAFLAQFVIGLGFGYLADRIKYKMVKTVEVGGYKYVD